ncbi:hypothetical protein Y032_0961g3223 [Ancylostoma ceylanicum]|uniref:Uncharacterized protein n=1 Tax=Ancylostoma ceylanicum TaxID=53326 RepID=A0A016W9D7_9BILA|nr:hypothetical protein Y032_0961g3223 [Ancylostoma ceylanicum]
MVENCCDAMDSSIADSFDWELMYAVTAPAYLKQRVPYLENGLWHMYSGMLNRTDNDESIVAKAGIGILLM